MAKRKSKRKALTFKQWLGMTVALSVVLAVGPQQAQALTVTIANDDSLLVGVTAMFEAEGRIGSVNASGNSTFELDLGPTTAAPAVAADFPWTNGAPFDFSLHYSPVTSLVTYHVPGASGSPYTYLVAPGFQGLATGEVFLRARTVDTAFDSMRLSQLMLDGVSLPDVASGTLTGYDRQVMRLIGPELLDGFLLTGTVTMTWDGTGPGAPAPLNSQLAFQIKGTTPSPVPVPGALWLFGTGALALIGLDRHVRRA
jgi:hypothetical protein